MAMRQLLPCVDDLIMDLGGADRRLATVNQLAVLYALADSRIMKRVLARGVAALPLLFDIAVRSFVLIVSSFA